MSPKENAQPVENARQHLHAVVQGDNHPNNQTLGGILASGSLDLWAVGGFSITGGADYLSKAGNVGLKDVTNDPNARLKFQEIAKAYETLGNPSKRKDYDRGLVQPASNYASVPYEEISEDSIKDVGADSFTLFYVKHYNRSLNESWLRQSDPEIIKTACGVPTR
ncbi:hypothetical protein AHF37_00008 [Paragonimus kellicotti]|nr:hypothetical protein AHF37_00008 [Paragonimus kellicotti]